MMMTSIRPESRELAGQTQVAQLGRDDGGRWIRGQSGNPTGPKSGYRHKATRRVQALLDGEAEALTRKAIELALQGDVTALRLCLERLLPPRKARPVEIDMPEVKDAAGVLAAIAATIDAMAQGQLSPEEAATVVGMLEVKRKAIETVQLEERLRRLEEQTERRR